MTQTLGAQFMEARARVIEHDGRRVFSMVELAFDGPRDFEISLAPAAGGTVQGVDLTLKGGTLEVAGQQGAKLALWSDDAPPTVETRAIVSVGADASLLLANTWRDATGGKVKWVGNHGILPEQEGDVVTLRCSHGEGAVNFDDLVITIRDVTPGEVSAARLIP